MSAWTALLWSLPPLIFTGLHLREFLVAQTGRATTAARIGASDPPPIFWRTGLAFDERVARRVRSAQRKSPFRKEDLEAWKVWEEYLTVEAQIGAAIEIPFGTLIVALLTPFILVPFRLFRWAWTERAWQPLALLTALAMVYASPIAWFSGNGASLEAHRHAVAFAWDAGFAAAVQAPVLLVLGAWPWWRWRGLIAGTLAALGLAFWLLVVLPARP